MTDPLSLTFLNIAGSLASLSGRGVFDMISAIRKTDYNREMAKRLMKVYENVKQPNDPLVGQWNLRQWRYETPENINEIKMYHPSNFDVHGDMRILYYDPSSKIWHGFMSLRYTHKNMLLKRKRNSVGIYRVEFQKTSKSKFKGYSEIIDRKPRNKKKIHRGDFSDFAIKGREFIGEFANVESAAVHPSIAKPVKFQGPLRLDNNLREILSLTK